MEIWYRRCSTIDWPELVIQNFIRGFTILFYMFIVYAC